MSGESFNHDTQEDAAHEGGAHAPLWRGSLEPSILAPTWLARFETPSAHGRGGAPPSLTFPLRSAYTFSDFLVLGWYPNSLSGPGFPRVGDSNGHKARLGPPSPRLRPRPPLRPHRQYAL